MKKLIFPIFLASTVILISCNNSQDATNSMDKTGTDELIFPKGSKIESDHFVGTAWLQWLATADSINHIGAGSVTFEPGARTNWHFHPDGQIIIVIDGIGYYQEQGSAKRILKKGDVVTCPPNIPHWHGASADHEFIQIAVTSRLKGPTEWLHAVSEEDYLAEEKQH